jgi:sucrose-phosphate synthase
VRRFYSWQSHAHSYLEQVAQLPGRAQQPPRALPATSAFRYRDRAIISDLDQNLLGNDEALQHFVETIRANRKCVTFGIATGRRVDAALSLMKKHGIPTPDVLISSLGTRIHYGRGLTEDDSWADHIDFNWSPQKVRRLLSRLPGTKLQPKKEQGQFKISYYYDPEKAPAEEEIINLLRQHEMTANVLFSFGQFMDVIPARASKGQALRYVSQRLDIPLEQILVAGGSGADEDMMRGNTLAVVVANRHHEELSQLVDQDSIYFASSAYATGILEAIDYYDFFDACRIPDA